MSSVNARIRALSAVHSSKSSGLDYYYGYERTTAPPCLAQIGKSSFLSFTDIRPQLRMSTYDVALQASGSDLGVVMSVVGD